MSVDYRERTRVAVEVVNCGAIDESIESLQKAIDGKAPSAADVVHLMDTMSILQGVRRNYTEHLDCSKHPVPVPKGMVEMSPADLLVIAQLLDDCLIRIYPEEFTGEHKEAAAKRFAAGNGAISRIADMADELRTRAKT